MQAIPTAVTAWHGGRIRLVSVPRVVITKLARGTVYGAPGDHQQQRRVLEATLALLEQDAPLDPVRLDESLETEA